MFILASSADDSQQLHNRHLCQIYNYKHWNWELISWHPYKNPSHLRPPLTLLVERNWGQQQVMGCVKQKQVNCTSSLLTCVTFFVIEIPWNVIAYHNTVLGFRQASKHAWIFQIEIQLISLVHCCGVSNALLRFIRLVGVNLRNHFLASIQLS